MRRVLGESQTSKKKIALELLAEKMFDHTFYYGTLWTKLIKTLMDWTDETGADKLEDIGDKWTVKELSLDYLNLEVESENELEELEDELKACWTMQMKLTSIKNRIKA